MKSLKVCLVVVGLVAGLRLGRAFWDSVIWNWVRGECHYTERLSLTAPLEARAFYFLATLNNPRKYSHSRYLLPSCQQDACQGERLIEAKFEIFTRYHKTIYQLLSSKQFLCLLN